MKKILITSTDLMMIQFLVPHVKHLSENGFHVEIACSVVGDRIDDVRKALEGYARAIHTVRLERSPVSPNNLKGYGDMKRLLAEHHYDIIWTNEPVMGVVTRLAARKLRRAGTKVFYMCHGFHFFDGASLPNWLIFYPVERIMAHFCDGIITMNREDYDRASAFKTCPVYKIPGVGVDMNRFHFQNAPDLRIAKRIQLGIPQDAYVLLSVGELSKRKNQEVALHAMKKLADPSIHYVLCGRGGLREHLEQVAAELGLTERVHFLGYRLDVPEMYRMADCFVFPSVHEGLPFALMEAMESGLPIVCSRIRGNVDLIDDQVGGILCDVHNSDDYYTAIRKIQGMDKEKMAAHNRRKLTEFDLSNTKHLIEKILNNDDGAENGGEA